MSRPLLRSMQALFAQGNCYVGGKWVPAASGNVFGVTNPATDELIAQVPDCSSVDAMNAIDAAKTAFQTWKNTTARERSTILRRISELHEKYQPELSQIVSAEVGKVIKDAIGEIIYGGSYYQWYSEDVRRMNGDVIPTTHSDRKFFVVKEPAGVAALITPWNFPNAMIARKLSAALAAGCTCVIKPAEDTPLSALAICTLAEEAGVPPGVVNVITSKSGVDDVGQTLCASGDVRVLSFTGSSPVGKKLMKQSSSTIKKVSLELGGNGPFMVFESADIDIAVDRAMTAKFRNNGQACIAANRFLIQESIHDEFVEKFSSKIQNTIKFGDLLDMTTTTGPLINQQAVNKVERYVLDAVSKGGNVILGGRRSDYGKNYYEPTVITNANNSMQMFREEIFGPIAGIQKFGSEDEAIELANGTSSGLSAYFFSTNHKQIWRLVEKIKAGVVGVNEGLAPSPEVPYGGVKESGLGKEGSMLGINEYLDVKFVCLGGLS